MCTCTINPSTINLSFINYCRCDVYSLGTHCVLCLCHTPTHTVLQSKSPRVGEDGLILEPHTLSVVLKCLPREVRSLGPRRHAVVYTCFDVSDQYLAIGSEQGLVWILDLHATRLIRELNVCYNKFL